MNKVTLMGRLTKDPEVRTTSSNVNVCSFTLAVDRRFKSEGQPTADFIPCIAWRSTADFIKKYFTKGNKIAVSGSIQTRQWDDKDGKRHYATEVIVDEAEFCESKRTDGAGGYSSGLEFAVPPQAAPQDRRQPGPVSQETPAEDFYPLDDDSDVPF